MAFGLKYIAGAEEAKIKTLSKQSDSSDQHKSSSQSSNSPDQNPTQPASTARRFERTQPLPTKNTIKKDFNQIKKESYSNNEPEKNASSGFNGLPKYVQAKRLTLEVAAFMGWSNSELMEKEVYAESRPEEAIKEMSKIINDVIKPARTTAGQILVDAINKNQNDVVFMLVSSNTQKIYKTPKDKSNGLELLHGVIMDKTTILGSPFSTTPDLFNSCSLSENKQPSSIKP